MPTQDQNFTVDFGQGLDTKTDPKQVLPSKMTTLKNRVFTKPKQLKKVFGFDQKTQTQTTGGTIGTAYRGFAYNDELLLEASDAINGYSPSRDLWRTKNTIEYCAPTTTPLIKNVYNQSQMDCAMAGNYICYAWLDSRGEIRYQIEDYQSGAVLVPDSGGVTNTGTVRAPKVLAIKTTRFGIFYNDGIDIKCITIDTPTMATNAFGLVTGLDTTFNSFDVVCNQGTSVTVVNVRNATGNIDMTIFDTDLNLTSSVPGIETLANCGAVSLVVDTASSNKIYIGLSVLTSTSEYKYYCLMTNSAGSVQFAKVQISTAAAFQNISIAFQRPAMTGIVSATNTVKWFFDVPTTINALETATFVPSVYSNTITSAGTAGTMAVFHANCQLASRAFTSTIGSLYVNLVHVDTAQGTLFCVNAVSGVVAARILGEQAGENWDAYGYLPHVIAPASNKNRFINQFKNRIVTTSQTTFTIYGVAKIDLNFDTSTARQTVAVNNQLLMTGGVTRMYDGVSAVEHGFHLYPEIVYLLSNSGTYFDTSNMPITVTTAGAVGVAQVWKINNVCDAFYLQDGQYIKFSDSGDTHKYVLWFSHSRYNASSAPVFAGYTPVECTINGNWTALEVANAIYTTLKNAALTGITVTISYTTARPTITFTNTATGVCTAPVSTVAIPDALTPSATYSYKAVYEWQDQAGNLHRSSPSAASSMTLGGAGRSTNSTVVFVPPLTLSDKKSTSGTVRTPISVVLYRTVANGSIYYRASSPVTPIVNVDAGTGYVTINDIFSDTQIAQNEILYTDGNVLTNSCPPASTCIFKNRNRVWLYSAEQKQLWYSKQIVNGVGIAFSDLFTLQVDASGEDVIAINELDDKIIFFKKSQPLFTVGDGPNDTGQGQAFALPTPIVAPVGASEVNSIIKIPSGLIYKSQRGFFYLNRKLEASYLGGPVEAFNTYTCLASTSLPDFAQVRFLMSSNDFLIYDYEADQWAERPVSGTVVDAFLWKNQYVIVKSSGLVWVENQSSYQDNSTNIQTMAETGWIHLGGIEGFQRVKYAVVNGGYVSAHVLKVEVGYDYNTTYASNDTYTFTPATDPIRFKIHLRQQKCTAIRFRITDLGVASGSYTEGNTLTNLTLLVGVKPGVSKLAAANRG